MCGESTKTISYLNACPSLSQPTGHPFQISDQFLFTNCRLFAIRGQAQTSTLHRKHIRAIATTWSEVMIHCSLHGALYVVVVIIHLPTFCAKDLTMNFLLIFVSDTMSLHDSPTKSKTTDLSGKVNKFAFANSSLRLLWFRRITRFSLNSQIAFGNYWFQHFFPFIFVFFNFFYFLGKLIGTRLQVIRLVWSTYAEINEKTHKNPNSKSFLTRDSFSHETIDDERSMERK